MKIVIAGAGRVGYSIAQELVMENHNIIVIDESEERIKEISNNLDVLTIVGNAACYDTLKEADLKNVDLLIAVTKMDELNLLSCLTAKKLGVTHTIARVRNSEYFKQAIFLNDELGLSMTINPEEETASEISRILRFPMASKVESFANSKAESIEIKVASGSALDGVNLSDLRSKMGDVLVCAVKRDKEVFIPRGDFIIEAGDRLNIIGSYKNINSFIKKVGKAHNAKKTIVFGGGTITYYLAGQLVNTDISLKVIEKRKDECAKIKEAFPKVSVICANGNNPDILGEEGIEIADAFVAVSNDDDDNVISSMYALSSGVEKVVTKIKEGHIIAMLSNDRLDSIVQPSSIATQRVVRYVRSMQNAYGDSGIDAMYYIFDQKVEILEMKVNDNFHYKGIPLKELEVSHDAIVASIIHNGKCIIPTGNDVISSGDIVILATTRKGVLTLGDIVETK
ncbi:MAG: Trk system potassium transporter TrkA [Ruminococcaceae bacterium]|nr:Trk system potassium transporter TrkA [Oscillospiraceae bacterium]